MIIRKAALAAALSIVALIVPTTSYSAADPVIDVCLSAASTGGRILVYSNGRSSPWIGPGRCRGWYNGDGKARVLVETDYKIKPVGGTYGPCHNGPQNASNPPNVSSVWYRTKPLNYC